MDFYKKVKDEKQEEYINGFVNNLLREDIPSVYLGDIPKEKRCMYFNEKILLKDKYFETPIGIMIHRSLAHKYNSGKYENGNWTMANGVLFYFNKNMIIALDYYNSSEQNDVILVDSE